MKSWLKNKFTTLPLLVCCVAAVDAAQTNTPPAPAWANDLGQEIPPAQLVSIPAGNKQFKGILTEQVKTTDKSYALILPDIGQHPNWPELVKPLRTGLPGFGWSTLSMTLPGEETVNNDKQLATLIDPAAANMLAAQTFLQTKGAKNIILIAYGDAARLAVNWLGKSPQTSIKAVVLISMADGKTGSGVDSNIDLQKIAIPVLDISGGHDRPKVKMAARERQLSRKQFRQYRYLEIAGAEHHYRLHEDELIKRIRGWLTKQLKP